MSAKRSDPTTSAPFAARLSIEQGYRSCFCRSVEFGGPSGEPARLVFTESGKSFSPKDVYGDAPSPTRL